MFWLNACGLPIQLLQISPGVDEACNEKLQGYGTYYCRCLILSWINAGRLYGVVVLESNRIAIELTVTQGSSTVSTGDSAAIQAGTFSVHKAIRGTSPADHPDGNDRAAAGVERSQV
jgi:hypothetical protein